MIIDAIARYAAEDPRSLALLVNNAPVSYADLWRGIAVMESRIRHAAIPRGARVGVAIADLKTAWFAILALEKMDYPAFAVPQNGRLSQLNLANTGAILTDGHAHGAAVLDGGAPLINVASGSTAPAPGLGGGSPRPEAERFILFSSGTTGTHKKVQYNSALRDARVAAQIKGRGYGPQTRHFAGNVGPWTGHGYITTLAILSLGGTVIFHQLPDAMTALAAAKPTNVFATPGIAEDWLRQLGRNRVDARGMMVSVGGGPFSAHLFVAMAEAFQGAAFRHIYAATECGTIASTPIHSTRDLEGHTISPDAEVQIVSPSGDVLPPATAGAIRVRTDVSVRSYLDDPAASAAFFRDGWFYPGDMGAIGHDGRLILTGRFAEVINFRGDKVAPGALEEPIKRALNAREVAVFGRPTAGKLDELHVFIVEGSPLTQAIIENALSPVANAFSKIGVHKSEGLPRNSMGKVLYGQLRALLRP
jgi:acyl-coenzyme A synthetase/AMP-(fatty) acid ligase